MKELVKKFWLFGLVLVLAFGLSAIACGGGGDDDDDDDDDTGDDDIFDDDDTTDDDDTDDDCDPEISTPVFDFHGICHATPQGIDTCSSTSNPATANIPLADMYDQGTQTGWGIFIQYTDNGCDLAYYVFKDGSKEQILEGTECGTGSDMGVFFTWDKNALQQACTQQGGGTLVINDSIQLLDTCNFTSDVWEFTINVACP